MAIPGDDARLQAVGYLPLKDPALAREAVKAGIRDGVEAFWVSSDPAGERSPPHLDFDSIRATLERHGIPLVLHIGGGRRMDPRYHESGHVKPTDFLGGGETLRGKDYHAISHSPQSFLTAMIYDQVFQRFPALMRGVIELGATWLPGFVRILDQGYHAFRKMEPLLQGLEVKPSEIFLRNLRVSLFPRGRGLAEPGRRRGGVHVRVRLSAPGRRPRLTRSAASTRRSTSGRSARRSATASTTRISLR